MPLSLVLAFALSTAQPAAPPLDVARVPSIEVGERLARFDNLTPGTRTYLRYRIMDGVWRPMDLWRREVRFEERDGQRRMRIMQSWTGSTTAPHSLRLDSWFATGTFAPISHERRFVRAEETRNEGFLFAPGRVIGLPAMPENTRASFVQESPQPTFNFETDMEMVQALPLGPGYATKIRFYHPGGAAPADYILHVTGSTSLAGPAGPVEAWIVEEQAAVSPSGPPSRFFVAKKGQQVLRVEQPQTDGSMVVKVLLSQEGPQSA